MGIVFPAFRFYIGVTVKDLDKELVRAHLVIDYLYEALGPANDDILDMAYEHAAQQLGE
jgi:hypothetical protein